MSTPRVEVIVVTWNSGATLPGLLESLDAGLRGLDWHLTVADNASADDSVEIARQRVPACRVVQTGRNAGYAAAFNAAYAQIPPVEAVLIVNPDVRLAPGCVSALYERLGSSAPTGGRVGIAVPRLLDEHGQVARSLRREPTILRAFGEAVLGQRAGRTPPFGETVLADEAYHRDTCADWATGAVMLMSAECLAACGPWEESFFLYSEETEFSLRARDRGFATMLVAGAEATHLGGESGVSPALWSLLTVNRVRLYRMRHTAPATALFWAGVFAREAARALLLRTPRSRRATRALLRPATHTVGRHTRAATGGGLRQS
jgi:GT2 family glycosyltransferase